MKKTFRIIYTTMAACLLFLTACQKDDEKQAVQQTTTGGMQVSTITFDAFKANAKAFAALQKAAGNNNKDIINNGKGFFYDTANVIVVTYPGYKTYTFAMYRSTGGSGSTENLVIREDTNGNTETFVFEYNFNSDDITALQGNKAVDNLPDKTTHKSINNDVYYNSVWHRPDGTCYIYTWYDENRNYDGIQRKKDVECPESIRVIAVPPSGGGTVTVPSFPNPSNILIINPGLATNPIAEPRPGIGTNYGGGDSLPTPGAPVVTTPVVNIFYTQFTQNLRRTNSTKLLWLYSNPELNNRIISFLAGYMEGSTQRMDLAGKLLDFAMRDQNSLNAALKILDYLEKNDSLPESIQIAGEMMEVVENGKINADDINEINKIVDLQDNSSEGADAFKMLIKTATKGYINKPFDQQYYNNIDQYTEANLSTPDHVMWAVYFNVQCAILKRENPTWSRIRIYWEASKEMVHIALDVIGLVPVVGEVADLTNGVIYTLEGDGLNATLSFASMIPVAGIGATTIKYAKKTINITTSTKTTLKWLKNSQNIYTFGNRSQLRKVLNLATGDPRQAHHIIPWGKSNHTVVQRAAGSGNAFHMNQALNGIPLNNAVHSGSHANYDLKIFNKMENFIVANPNATPQQCYNKLKEIIQQVRTAIINNPNVHINNLNF